MPTDVLQGTRHDYRVDSLERRIDALEAQRLKDIKAKNDQIWEKANRSMHRVQGFMGGLLVGAWFMVAIRWLAGA
jgi:hypothetical protein